MSLTDLELLSIFNREVRRGCEWTRMQREELPNIVRYTMVGSIGAGGGYISWSSLSAGNANAEIDAQLAFYCSLNMEFEWKVYSYDQPADLGDRLEARGFLRDEPEALMVAEIDDLKRDGRNVDLSMVKRVTTPDELDAVIAMENEVWQEDMSALGNGLKHDLEHTPDELSIFAIREGNRVLSAAWSYYLRPTSFVSLFGGSTLKQYHGRGYYRALLAARALEARQRGYRFLCVDASPDSQPILVRNGFRCLAYSRPYEWKPEKQK